jgi:hypothetical protein
VKVKVRLILKRPSDVGTVVQQELRFDAELAVIAQFARVAVQPLAKLEQMFAHCFTPLVGLGQRPRRASFSDLLAFLASRNEQGPGIFPTAAEIPESVADSTRIARGLSPRDAVL